MRTEDVGAVAIGVTGAILDALIRTSEHTTPTTGTK